MSKNHYTPAAHCLAVLQVTSVVIFLFGLSDAACQYRVWNCYKLQWCVCSLLTVARVTFMCMWSIHYTQDMCVSRRACAC